MTKESKALETVLKHYHIAGKVTDIKIGPVVTLYELEPVPGTKFRYISNLSDDIARSMSAVSCRITTVPGRNVIGLEIPNPIRDSVPLKEILESQDFEGSMATLPVALGKNIMGDPVVVDLAKMSHLLGAGTTGSGKSVGINTMIVSLLNRFKPNECKFIMIDPKMLEFAAYNGIPHLLFPVVTDPLKAVRALQWAVQEMTLRYDRMDGPEY